MSVTRADLGRAERLLVSDLPGSSRMAAWLARTALEDAVVGTLRTLGHDPGAATMRSRLTCLHVLDPERATVAEFAWNRLSSACHQHAFELDLTAAEVRTLVERVHAVVAGSGPGRSAG